MAERTDEELLATDYKVDVLTASERVRLHNLIERMTDAEMLQLDFTKVSHTREQMQRRGRAVQRLPNPLALPPMSDADIVKLGKALFRSRPDLCEECRLVAAEYARHEPLNLPPDFEQRMINASNAIISFCEAQGYSKSDFTIADVISVISGAHRAHLLARIKLKD